MICPTCQGDGSHAQHLGEIRRDDWSDEEFDDYMAGGYDQTCETCQGSGKVREDQKIKRNRYFDTQAELDRYIESGGWR
jgi:DnaJ-class molecular chaperone